MEQTLLLNATYEPLKIVHWQKAITLMCQGKVEVVREYDREIHSVSISFRLPSVIRLLRFIKIKRRFDYVPFSRANIYARDDHKCQYCGDEFPTSELTFDHVLPVAQGGRLTIEGSGFAIDGPQLPQIQIGDARARVVFASPNALTAIVPPGLDAGHAPVRISGVPGETAFIDIAAPVATGLHQVDNPVFD